MADSRFFSIRGPFRLGELAALAGAELVGNGDLMINDVAALDTATSDNVTFFDNPKYRAAAQATGAGACLARPGDASALPDGVVRLLCDNPLRSYARVAQAFYPLELAPADDTDEPGSIDPDAHVDEAASVDKGVRIAAGAVVEAGAVLGPNCRIAANAVISAGVQLGASCLIGPGVTLTHAILGDRVIVHAGARIGQDGFGFALGAAHLKVPQLGRVIIGDDAEIGANSTIDRGSGPDTVIGAGSKIDNLVQIAHNVVLGEHCIVVAQSGISGSTQIGDGSVLAAQVGVTGHLKIGPRVQLVARTAVIRDLPGDAAYGGAPALPIREWRRHMVALMRLGRKG